ncbi:hypothetical protein C3747_158g78 [Trypanosoma cruzi]|uniref:Uncharacterized protein n=1 Tax=Trypanosoma cruzi TaxID=5693 RepID=A0A2V2W6T8_TRYCR|nr:hypothetical protein C3747_158g78 [Trypanosoma cruzi]
MVRVKAKARKGDDAFQTRKQKVGRKKLAPATATRAEVHARTLRVTTPSAIARTTSTRPSGKGTIRREKDASRRVERNCTRWQFRRKRCIMTSRSSFRIRGIIRRRLGLPASCHSSGQSKGTTRRWGQSPRRQVLELLNESDEALLNPIEILSAFTSALDAMLDTDNDVRRAALATLETILQPSPSSRDRGVRDEKVSPIESTVSASGRGRLTWTGPGRCCALLM